MTKEDILEGIRHNLYKDNSNKGQNRMGVSESYYNSYYLLGMFFTKDKTIDFEECGLRDKSEEELKTLVEFADFATEVFY